MCVPHLNTGTLGHVHTTKTTRVKLRGVRLVKQTCGFGQWGILKVSEFGGFVLRSVIFWPGNYIMLIKETAALKNDM